MNVKRYALCIVFSFVIHGIAFSSSDEPIELSMDSNDNGTTVSLQFVAPTPPPAATAPVEEKPKKAPQKVEKKPEPTPEVQQEKPPVSKPKSIKKPEPVKKALPVKKKTPKPVEKKPEPKIEEKVQPIETAQITKEQLLETKKEPSHTSSAMPKMVSKPSFKTKPTPINYPRLAKRRNWQGDILIEVWLDQSGKQIKQHIVNSSGFDLLDSTALKTISKWKFEQYQESGQPIAHRVQIPVTFKLD
ncbi:hypothetical protein BCU68_08365 [Vibrio sp. 10N.286.49.B3]|uniref:energy transducer TonB n=1 Tax=Vibrio sp. 10N.286.49.B3 TaxID=1880855 RepID=UPI000C81543B|nr:energy transducer TonB [Vibrio sp. 10N.286.49.B3]PMH37103.1 hypothetical protein BCU68_08365 [Vibrio sp. 10N.286.49.B3]